MGGFYLVFISSWLSITFDSLWMPIITWRDESDASDTGSKNTNPLGSGENVSSSLFPFRSDSYAENTNGKSIPHGALGPLKGPTISYEGSHMLSMFLYNPSLYITQVNLILSIYNNYNNWTFMYSLKSFYIFFH